MLVTVGLPFLQNRSAKSQDERTSLPMPIGRSPVIMVKKSHDFAHGCRLTPNGAPQAPPTSSMKQRAHRGVACRCLLGQRDVSMWIAFIGLQAEKCLAPPRIYPDRIFQSIEHRQR